MSNKTKLATLAILTVVLLCTTVIATLSQEASTAVQQLKQEKIPTATLTQLLEQLKNATDTDAAKELHHNIMLKTNDARKTQTKLSTVNRLLQQGHDKKLSMQNTQTIFILARTAFQREEFSTALDRATQAETTANVELKQFPLTYILTYYWWALLLAIILVTMIVKTSYPTIKTKILNTRIHNLLLEEKNIIHLLQQTQEQHYTTKKLSTSQYHKTMYNHQHRLSTIRKQLDYLRTQRAALHSTAREQTFLKQEEKQVEELIKQTQENYFTKQTISKTEYEQQFAELRERLAAIEERQVLIERIKPTQKIIPIKPAQKAMPSQREHIIDALKKTYAIPTKKEAHT